MKWARWRIPFMILIYVIFFLHVAIYHYWGIKTVGHLGFGEFFGALTSGVVTAGTIFCIVVFIHALFFGGLFCGWICHWGILQDLAIWVFRKLGIKPKMVKVKSLWVPWVWFSVIIGQVVFSWYHLGFPTSLKFALGATPVWSGVPRSIFLICLTTIASGFLLVFLFGERAFCRTICTFRLWFSWVEIFAPHKIRQKQACVPCEKECGSGCPMGIDVAGEVQAFGAVKNTGCVKCYICVLDCPGTVLEASSKQNFAVTPKTDYEAPPVDIAPGNIFFQSLFSVLILLLFCGPLGGNVSMSLGFVLGFIILRVMAEKRLVLFETVFIPLIVLGLVFRGDLNDPTSLAKGLGAIVAFFVIAKVIGYARGESFIQEKGKSFSPHAGITAVLAIVVVALGIYNTVLSFQKYEIRALEKSGDYIRLSCLLENQVAYLPDKPEGYKKLELANLKAGELKKAQENLQKSLGEEFKPETARIMYQTLLAQDKAPEALALLDKTLASFPYYLPFLKEKATRLTQLGDMKGSEEMLIRILTADADDPEAHRSLGMLRLSQNRKKEAERELQLAYLKSPGDSAKYLARFYSMVGSSADAERFFQEAIITASGDPTLYFDQGINFAKQDKVSKAIDSWQKVLELDPQCLDAKQNIERARERLATTSSGVEQLSQ